VEALGHVDAVVAEHLDRRLVLDVIGDRLLAETARAIWTIALDGVSWSASLLGMSRTNAPSILIRSKGMPLR